MGELYVQLTFRGEEAKKVMDSLINCDGAIDGEDLYARQVQYSPNVHAYFKEGKRGS